MPNQNLETLQQLLRNKAELNARLQLLPYDGTPEIKTNKNGKQYLYIRKRIAGKQTSTYVDVFSDELYTALLRYSREARELKKQIRKIEKELAVIGYTEQELSPQVQLNLDFARANMKSNIYDQAILEGVTTTFPQTETVIENGIVSGMTPTDIQKIINLKHAWELILDKAENNDILILTDLYGCTPFNIANRFYKKHDNIFLISGMNLDMVIEYFASDVHDDIHKLIEDIVSVSRDSIVLHSKKVRDLYEDIEIN